MITGRLRGKAGLPSLLVLRDEACACFPREARPDLEPALSHGEAATRLGVNVRTISALGRIGLLDFERRRTASGRMVRGPTVASIERFEREMVTATEIAGIVGKDAQKVIADLRRAGVVCRVAERKGVRACYDRMEAFRAYGLPPFNREQADPHLVGRRDEPTDPLPTISCTAASLRLNVTRITITALRNAQVLHFAFRFSEDGRRIPAPTVESIEWFEREVATAVELAGRTGKGIKRVISELRRAGIRNLVEQRPGVQACYERCEAFGVFGLGLPDATEA